MYYLLRHRLTVALPGFQTRWASTFSDQQRLDEQKSRRLKLFEVWYLVHFPDPILPLYPTHSNAHRIWTNLTTGPDLNRGAGPSRDLLHPVATPMSIHVIPNPSERSDLIQRSSSSPPSSSSLAVSACLKNCILIFFPEVKTMEAHGLLFIITSVMSIILIHLVGKRRNIYKRRLICLHN